VRCPGAGWPRTSTSTRRRWAQMRGIRNTGLEQVGNISAAITSAEAQELELTFHGHQWPFFHRSSNWQLERSTTFEAQRKGVSGAIGASGESGHRAIGRSDHREIGPSGDRIIGRPDHREIGSSGDREIGSIGRSDHRENEHAGHQVVRSRACNLCARSRSLELSSRIDLQELPPVGRRSQFFSGDNQR
jgi:hypothetical protein